MNETCYMQVYFIAGNYNLDHLIASHFIQVPHNGLNAIQTFFCSATPSCITLTVPTKYIAEVYDLNKSLLSFHLTHTPLKKIDSALKKMQQDGWGCILTDVRCAPG